MTNSLKFQPITDFSPGVIEHLLAECFADLAVNDVQREECRNKWRNADRETFANPETVGRCTFITILDGRVIGMGSFDPRGGPAMGEVGMNCILPANRGCGFGRRQLEEILRRLAECGIQKAVVTTGDHPFFAAAQRMYQACGFHETRRFQKYDLFDWQVIEFMKELG
ncbi:MAG: GNAT family N-acetyltransferase [Phycisphaerae bacterium]|nr:GNAT family N-acetyltransferase [Phycisphaerae bacterium]